MKTMKQGTNVVRVKESDVNSKLNQGYVFCSKSEWKTKVRDTQVVKTEVQSDVEKVASGNPKGKAKKNK